MLKWLDTQKKINEGFAHKTKALDPSLSYLIERHMEIFNWSKDNDKG